MARVIDLHPKAFADIQRAVGGLVRHVSANSAARWQSASYAAINALAHDAERWPEAHEAAKLGRDLRCRLFRRWRHVYRILFTIDGQTVNVHRVRHASQDDITVEDI